MHDNCEVPDKVTCGDSWLKTELPPLLAYANSHESVVFVVWDEGRNKGDLLPFYAFGPSLRPGYRSPVAVNHRSLVRTIDEIFALPMLDAVRDDSDLADLFTAKQVPVAAPRA